jgi:ABC-2 type transport system permease protein
VLVVAWRFELANLTRSSLFIVAGLAQPVIYASIAFFLDEAGGHRPLLYSALGAGMMGIWASTLSGSGMAIQTQRRQGVLELLVLAPHPYATILGGLTLATASLGIYSLAATLLWGWLLFGVPLAITHVGLFAVAVVATVVGLGAFGLLMGSTFVLWRGANALTNLLEYPVWLVSGMLVPLIFLPGWVRPVSWLLAPTWGAQAIRRAAAGGSSLPAVGYCLLLAGVYVLLGVVMLRYIEHRARKLATLALA